MNLTKNKLSNYALLTFILIVFTVIFINTAHVTEDAFITFRAVDNFLKGYGPVYNVGERVQVYTHPLWYFLITAAIGIFKNHYYTVIVLSYICLMITIWLILIKLRREDNLMQIIAALLALLVSRAFMDYSSSGLENPLLHLLLVIYVCVLTLQKDNLKRFFYTSLLYNLIFLTRPDAIVIITPISSYFLAITIKSHGLKQTLKYALFSVCPTLAWEMFSLIYYGSLVPNTALSKVNISYPRIELFDRGIAYLKFNLREDTVTLVTIICSFIFVWFNKNIYAKILMLGVVLQMLYICYVGADYMLGRFLTTSILVAMLSFILMEFNNIVLKRVFINCSIFLTVFLVVLFFPLYYGANLSYSIDHDRKYTYRIHWNLYGVSDEKVNYFQELGLIPVIKKHSGDPYTYPWIIEAKEKNIANKNITILAVVAGMPAWYADEKPYFLEPHGLTNPYTSRLPALPKKRIGHYERVFPKGYLETLMTGKNVITDPMLAKLYDDVALQTQGSLWRKERFFAIWRLNSGYYKKIHENFDFNNTDTLMIKVDDESFIKGDRSKYNTNNILALYMDTKSFIFTDNIFFLSNEGVPIPLNTLPTFSPFYSDK